MTNPYIEALASLHAAMGSIISMLRDNSSLADDEDETPQLTKEELQERLISVAHAIIEQGDKPTLAECARRVGVPYYRAVYAMKGIDLPN